MRYLVYLNHTSTLFSSKPWPFPAVFIFQKKVTVMKKAFKILALCLTWFAGYGQTTQTDQTTEGGGAIPIQKNDASNPCITKQEYAAIEKRVADNQKLIKNPAAKQTKTTSTLFSWPLAGTNGFRDCSYYVIFNYVDQDTTSSGIRDYNCGSVTYDGHRGNDLALEPFPFYMMDNNQVEVIAAAPGTIIDKSDGNFDKNCAMNSLTANYVIIQHADGSVALYWHMKKNTVTSKTVGQTVTAGEHLGYVGSSGSSTAPHLHFEVWSSTVSTSLVDVYSGTCNLLNSSSWWQVQKPYTEPAVIKVDIDTATPVFPACPATETSNEDSCYPASGSAKFVIFLRNETIGDTVHLRIVNPNNTTFSTWLHNSTTQYLSSYWYWTRSLPNTTGTYTFEAVYNGDTCRKNFSINCGQSNDVYTYNLSVPEVYPIPAGESVNVSVHNIENGSYILTLKNVMGQTLMTETGIIENSFLQRSLSVATLPGGLYFLNIETGSQRFVKKLIKQ